MQRKEGTLCIYNLLERQEAVIGIKSIQNGGENIITGIHFNNKKDDQKLKQV